MSQKDFEARIWMREQMPDGDSRLLVRDITTLDELSMLLKTTVSMDMLNDRKFRRSHAITMVSSIRDKDGGIVCERDVVAYGSRHRSENYHAVRYGFSGTDEEPRFTLHRVGETVNWGEGTALNSTKVASYYDNPDAYAPLFSSHYDQG